MTTAAASIADAAEGEGAGQRRDVAGVGASRPAGPVRLGPSTAPTVVAHTTSDSERPRVASGARSVAA